MISSSSLSSCVAPRHCCHARQPWSAGSPQARTRITRTSRPRHVSATAGAKEALLTAVQDTNFGLGISPGKAQQVQDLVKQLQASPPKGAAYTSGPMQGDWRLLYTTELSVHKIVGGLVLGMPVQAISQRVDLQEKRVTNCIQFAKFGAGIKATAPLTVQSSSRIQYTFDGLSLLLLKRELPFPFFPRAGGWTEAVYLDADIRVMQNSQGDTLVFVREGAE